MQTSDVIRRVQRIFGDNNESQIYVNDVIDWINDGQMEIVRQTQVLQKVATFDVTVGTEAGPFPLPTDFLFEARVTFKGVTLAKTSLPELDQFNQAVDLTSVGMVDVPSYYYLWGNSLYLYPPTTALAPQAVKLWYINSPVLITASGDPLSLPLAYHEDIVRYALMRAHESNENYSGADRVASDFQSRMGVSRDQAQNPSDSYPVVRDYAGDTWAEVGSPWP